MATITKTGARKPLASGTLYRAKSANQTYEGLTLSLLTEDTPSGGTRYITLNLSRAEAEALADYIATGWKFGSETAWSRTKEG